MNGLLDSGAEFSADRLYRWRLWRRWDHGPVLMVIGLNPSTADEHQDDPTVRRCIGFARAWGFAGLRMFNVFAYRATDPRQMIAHMQGLSQAAFKGVVGTNVRKIRTYAEITIDGGGAVLAAWGNHARQFDMSATVRWNLYSRAEGVRRLDVACLGRTQSGEPKHPLYLANSVQPEPYLGDGGVLVVGRTAL